MFYSCEWSPSMQIPPNFVSRLPISKPSLLLSTWYHLTNMETIHQSRGSRARPWIGLPNHPQTATGLKIRPVARPARAFMPVSSVSAARSAATASSRVIGASLVALGGDACMSSIASALFRRESQSIPPDTVSSFFFVFFFSPPLSPLLTSPALSLDR